jgi:hypothetical protein
MLRQVSHPSSQATISEESEETNLSLLATNPDFLPRLALHRFHFLHRRHLFLEAGVALGVPAPFLVGVFGVGVPLPLALADCRLVERAPYLEGDGGLALGIMVGE